MALGPRLDLRQSQSLVMTPQLQQAIRLLAASNLEIETFIADALETNPLLEAGGITREAAEPVAGDVPETPPDLPTADELIQRGAGEADAPLDLAGAALDRDVDTGDGARSLRDAEWGAGAGGAGLGPSGDDYSDFAERSAAEITLREHL
ncbi:MAG: RNA polymerase sigma-54 factor, partial [Roseinatronobacter sp.]